MIIKLMRVQVLLLLVAILNAVFAADPNQREVDRLESQKQ